MTNVAANGAASVAAEPTFEATAATPVARTVRRAHAAPTREQVMARWKASPKWFRRGVGIPAGLLGAFLVWTLGIAPTLRAAASHEAHAEVTAAFGAETETMTSVLGAYVDQRIGEAQSSFPPVVVVGDPLGMLPCGLSMNAKALIGASKADPTKVDPDKAQLVADQIRKASVSVPLAQLRLTMLPNGALHVGAEGVAIMDPCPANGAPAAAPAAAAPITPPAGAN